MTEIALICGVGQKLIEERSKMNPVNEETIIAAMDEMRKNDTTSIQAASNYLLSVISNIQNMGLVFAIISKPYPDSTRQLAALLCRRMVLEFYKQYDDASKQNLKSACIQSLRVEKNILVKRSICGIISAIASFDAESGQCADIVELVKRDSQSPDWQDRECSVLLVFSLSAYIEKVFDENTINTILISGLNDPSTEVVNMTVKSCSNILINMVAGNTVKYIQPTLSECVKAVVRFVNMGNFDNYITLMTPLSEIIRFHSFSDEDACALIQLSLNVLQTRELDSSIRIVGSNFLIHTIITYSGIYIVHNMIGMLIETAIRYLSDDVDEGGEDEEETVGGNCEMLLDAIGEEFDHEQVFNTVIQFSSQLVASANWKDRRSALTSMLVIMEYTSDYFRPILNNLLGQIRPLLHDPIHAVSRKAAFLFSETSTYCESIFATATPFLLGDLQEMLRSPDEFVVTNALYVFETYNSMISQLDLANAECFIDILTNIASQASTPLSQSLSISCIDNVYRNVSFHIQSRASQCIYLALQVLTQPMQPNTVDIHANAIDLLSSLLTREFVTIKKDLPEFIKLLYLKLENMQNLDLAPSIFNFVTVAVGVLKQEDQNIRTECVQAIRPFLPMIESIVFSTIEFVEVDIPKASEEFGSLSGMFSTKGKEDNMAIVRLDSERADCKAYALKAYMEIMTCDLFIKDYLDGKKLEELSAHIVDMCNHSSSSIRFSAIRAVKKIIMLWYDLDTYSDSLAHEIQKTSKQNTLKIALMFLHLFDDRIQNEDDEETCVEMINALSTIISIVGTEFCQYGLDILLKITSTILNYNAPCQEDYIDDVNYVPTHDNCPIVVSALHLLCKIFVYYKDIKNMLSQDFFPSLWGLIKLQLVPETDGNFLAKFLALASTLLQYVGSDCVFIVQDLLAILPCSLEKRNESCRAESCRCLGWMCQVFPVEMSDSINYVIECILKAMQLQEGDCGTVVDVATGALNRILKNVMHSPRQDLFINVLNNLPPVDDTSEADFIYKTLFEVYENKGEFYTKFYKPMVQTFIRSIIRPSALSLEFKDTIIPYIIRMYQDDKAQFEEVLQTFTPVEVQQLQFILSSVSN